MGTRRTGPKCMGERLGAWPDDRPASGQAEPWTLWLRRSLLETYGDVTAEPVPADLLRIIEGAGGGEGRNG